MPQSMGIHLILEELVSHQFQRVKYKLQGQKELGTKHLVLCDQGNQTKHSISVFFFFFWFENRGNNDCEGYIVNMLRIGVGRKKEQELSSCY